MLFTLALTVGVALWQNARSDREAAAAEAALLRAQHIAKTRTLPELRGEVMLFGGVNNLVYLTPGSSYTGKPGGQGRFSYGETIDLSAIGRDATGYALPPGFVAAVSESGEFLLTGQLYNAWGRVVARVINSAWDTDPSLDYDVNSDVSCLEVVNRHGSPILQISVGRNAILFSAVQAYGLPDGGGRIGVWHRGATTGYPLGEVALAPPHESVFLYPGYANSGRRRPGAVCNQPL